MDLNKGRFYSRKSHKPSRAWKHEICYNFPFLLDPFCIPRFGSESVSTEPIESADPDLIHLISTGKNDRKQNTLTTLEI